MWKTAKLGDIVTYEKVNGQGSNLPYVGMEHISSETMELVGSLEIPEKTSSTFKFDERHVLFGRLRPYLKKVFVPGFDGQCSTEIFCILPSDKVDKRFLAHWLLHPKVSTRINETSTGARMPRANMNAILDFDIPLPPLAEQQRIVAKLDAAFAEIDTAIEIVEETTLQSVQVYQNELSKSFKNIDECEPRRTLADVAKVFGRGKSKHRPRNDERLYGDKIPFIQTGHISNAKMYVDSFDKGYSEFGISQSKIWDKGTVCITIAANIAELAILDMDACFPDSVIGVYPDKEITSSEYIFYLLSFFQIYIKSKSKGSAQQNINLATFESETFPFPSNLAKQNQIVDRLKKLQEELGLYQSLQSEKLHEMHNLKSAILAQELTPPSESEAA